ncbi:MAG TPA: hypothetical protein VFW83_04990 [Bryobacteraceae bacterium]|nr:hypothetical protein [Bryobacteraceae bacterium]
MKKRVKKPPRRAGVRVATGTAGEFFRRSLERARKLDRGEKLPAEIRLTFEDPADLLRVLSTERIRVLHTVRVMPRPVSGLASILKRDRKAVSRDVKILESFGLVRTHSEPNPGHGSMKIVEPLASRYQLIATI